MNTRILYGAKIEKLSKKRKKKLEKQLSSYCKKFLKKQPKAEKWFWKLWKELEVYDKNDYSNLPFGFFIPDVINHKYKYIIEIDEEFHRTDKQQIKRDHIKDYFYEKQGFTSFRIIAYDQNSFNEVKNGIEKLRIEYELNFIKKQVVEVKSVFIPKIILRKKLQK